MIQQPAKLFEEARASDSAVAGVCATSTEQVTNILGAVQGMVAVVVSGEVLARHPNMLSVCNRVAQESEATVMLQLENPTGRMQALDAIEAGVRSFIVADTQLELAAELQRKGAIVFVSLPDMALSKAKEIIKAKIDGVVLSPPLTKGAYTGQEYVVFERLENFLYAIPQVKVAVRGVSGISDEHIAELASFSIVELLFDIEVAGGVHSAVNKMVVAGNKNLLH